MKFSPSNISRIAIIVWLVLWANFIARDLFKAGKLAEYKVLAASTAEEKRAYTYGRRFYEFLKSAKKDMPENASYDFVNIPDFSLDSRRGIYYLYPRLKKKNADYILEYKE